MLLILRIYALPANMFSIMVTVIHRWNMIDMESRVTWERWWQYGTSSRCFRDAIIRKGYCSWRSCCRL